MNPITDYSTAIVRFAASSIPESARECARLRILDSMGIAIAAAKAPPVVATLTAARTAYGSGTSRLIGLRETLSPAGAALVNATLIHALDYDDTYLAGAMHISAPVVAASLAAAEVAETTVGRLVDGAALGTEVACWLGRIAPRDLHGRGFQPTALFGAIGGCVAASHILGLSPAAFTNAIGVCASVAAGLCQFEESWVKNWNVAWAAQTGLSAALAAQSGFVGPRFGIEGDKGIFAAHLGLRVPTPPAESLGEAWASETIALKKYACCHFIHAAIDCALELARRVDVGAIERVTVFAPQLAIDYTAVPVDIRRRPTTIYRARFAGPWIIARALLERQVTLRTFEDAAAAPSEVLRLADRVDFVAAEFPTFPRDWPGRIQVTMKDGTAHTASSDGSPLRIGAANREVILEKLRSNLHYASVPDAMRLLLAAIAQDQQPLSALWQCVPAGFPASPNHALAAD